MEETSQYQYRSRSITALGALSPRVLCGKDRRPRAAVYSQTVGDGYADPAENRVMGDEVVERIVHHWIRRLHHNHPRVVALVVRIQVQKATGQQSVFV